MTNHEKQTPIERTNHSSQLYGAAFGRIIDQPTSQLIVDIAAGDADFADARAARGQRVIRVDRDYGRVAPKGTDWVADDARNLSLDTATSDVTVSAFLMQHLSDEDQARAIAEMLRITKPYDGSAQGVVGLFPVYRPDRLQAALDAAHLDEDAFIMFDDERFASTSIRDRKLAMPTLWIPNQGDPEMREKLIRTIAESGALSRRRTIADMARKAMMRANGDSRIHFS